VQNNGFQDDIFILFFVFSSVVLVIQPRALSMLGKHSIPELRPAPTFSYLHAKFFNHIPPLFSPSLLLLILITPQKVSLLFSSLF
jgi:hypothetical protein